MRKLTRKTIPFLLIALMLAAVPGWNDTVCAAEDPEDPAAVEAQALTVTLKAKARYNKKVLLTWTKASGAQGYEVIRKGKVIARIPASRFNGSSFGSYRDTGLKKKKRYTYRVRAWSRGASGKAVYGPFSRPAVVKTKFRQPRFVMADRNDPQNQRIARAYKKLG